MKGTMSTAAQLGLVVLFAILFLVFLGSLTDAFAKSFDRLGCQGSLLAQSSIKPTGNTIFFAQCPSYDVTVKDDEILIDNGNIERAFEVIDNGRVKKSYNELKEEYVYQAVADEMEYCWNLYFEGNRDVFSRKWFGFDTSVSDPLKLAKKAFETWGDKRVCFACDTILFETSQELEFSHFDRYLEHEYTARHDKDTTYADYFTQTPQDNKKTIEELYEQSYMGISPVFNTNNKYIIAFIKQGGANPINGGDYFMAVAPYQDLNQYCSHWVYPSNR